MHEGEIDEAPPPGLYGWYVRVMKWIGAAGMAALVVIMMVQVVARYGFNSSLIWAEEICRYILIWITFLFIGLAFQRGELVAVDIVPLRLSPKAAYIMKAVVSIPVLGFVGLMIYYSHSFFGRFTQQTIPGVDFIWQSITGRSANVSILWVYYSVMVGCTLLFVHILVSLVAEGRALMRQIRDPLGTGYGR